MANIVNQKPMQVPVSPFDPNADLDVKRKRKLAEILMKQGEQPQGTEVVSGVAVKQSPWAGLARSLTQGLGGYTEGQADKAEAKMQQDKMARMAAAIQSGKFDSLAQGSPDERMLALKARMDADAEARKFAQEMQLAKYKQSIDPTSSGGAMGSLVKQYMQATGLPFDQALYAVQTGMRQGMTMSPDGSVMPMAGVPEAKGAIKAGEASGQEIGKAQGEAGASLNNLNAQMPKLEEVTRQLSELGKKATYTKAGQIRDIIKRETGQKVGEPAVARTEYISKVDNEILPLLRQTFGAQFTQKEGESLKVTLGDPDKSPEEKDAVLRSFISSKKAQVEALGRQVGQQPQLPNQTPQSANSYKDKYGLE